MRLKASFLSLFCVFVYIGVAQAEISFTHGFWSTSFEGCALGPKTAGWTCDGIIVPDNYTCEGTYSQIRTTENNALGGIGNVFSIYMHGGARNNMSTPLQIRFPSPQKEFWIKFYYRLPNGQEIGSINEHKIIYAWTDSSVSANVNWPGDQDHIMLQPRQTMGMPDITYTGIAGTGIMIHRGNGGPSGGWATVYGNVSSPANGSWHSFEFHFDLGTSGGNDGKFEMWVDGVNYVHDFALDWFNDGAASPNGWSYVTLPSNHNVWTLLGCNPHDVDEIAVALPTYADFKYDSDGRKMIGQNFLSDQAPSAPTGLKIIPSN